MPGRWPRRSRSPPRAWPRSPPPSPRSRSCCSGSGRASRWSPPELRATLRAAGIAHRGDGHRRRLPDLQPAGQRGPPRRRRPDRALRRAPWGARKGKGRKPACAPLRYRRRTLWLLAVLELGLEVLPGEHLELPVVAALGRPSRDVGAAVAAAVVGARGDREVASLQYPRPAPGARKRTGPFRSRVRRVQKMPEIERVKPATRSGAASSNSRLTLLALLITRVR